jgi:PAS domain S-box-containing protein
LEAPVQKDKSRSKGCKALREKAEKLLSERPGKNWPGDVASLTHELEVHQIELEMQNEKLRRTQLETEESQENYLALYGFAPVGYITINEKGMVSELNLAGAALLGLQRKSLVNKPFSAFIQPEFQDAFYRHRQEALKSPTKQTCELALKKSDGAVLHAQLDSIGVDINGERVMRTVITDITKRKVAEETLRQSQQRYYSLFENMLDGFAHCKMLFDDRGRPVDFVYLEVNSAFERLTGLKNVKGKRVTEVIPGIREAHPEVFEMCGRVASTGRPERFEIEVTPLGAWFAVSVYSTERGYFVAVFDNITERKRAESRVQREIGFKDFLLLLHEKAPQLSDKELYDYVLEETVRLTGSTVGFFHRVSDDQKTVVLTTWNSEALKTCTASYETHYHLEQAGNWADCVRLKRPVIYNDFDHSPNRKGLPEGHAPVRRFASIPVTEGDKVRAIFGVGNKPREYDDTDAQQILLVANALHAIMKGRRAEMALRNAHEELEERVRERTAELKRQAELLNLTHDAIMARDLHHRIVFWNRGARELFGWTSDEAEGKVMHKLLQTIAPRPRQEIEEELLLRGRWEGKLVHTTRDGRKITVASRQALRRDRDGKPIAILEINSDVTEQKLMEEQLRQAQKMEAVGTLSGGIAHDFNNILAAIIGFAEMVLEDVSDNVQVQHKMEQILKAGLRGRDLIRQILTFSRKAGVERKRINLALVATETHQLLRASLPSTIRTALDFATKEDFVFADPTQIQQVLMNLATNAAHSMQEGGGLLTIGISLATFPQGSMLPDPDLEPGTYLKLTVKDTGTGMTEEVRQRVFEPFFTTKDKGKGTGMGLAVAYGIVKAHGGALTVQSDAGQGSTFAVFLPQAQTPEAMKEEITTPAVPGGTEQILFVDDEEMLVEMGRVILESLGYYVTVAANGTEALNLFLEDPSRFDLVITDQTMPDVTGVDLAQKMLGVRKEMPVILCTGYSEMVSTEKVKKVGIREFVMKPMVKKELAETIRRVLDGRKVGV